MKIKVEGVCGSKLGYRMTDPQGRRETVSGVLWTRTLAKKALDIWENVYGYKRRNIRFIHH